MSKILVSTPTYRSQVHSLYLAGAISAARSTDVGFQTFTHPVISVARNELTKRFLEAKDFDHLLFVDSDIGWQKSDLDTLLAREKDVISGCYVRKGENTIPAEPTDDHWKSHPDYPLQECSLLPAGFLLLSRRAVEDMYETYGYYMWSLVSYDLQSEDYEFCRRYRAMKGQMWLDTSVRLKHVGEVVFEIQD
jgi:hypothetical protein